MGNICPKCKSSTSVVEGEPGVYLCTKCHRAWEMDDVNKSGWVCPTHGTILTAWSLEPERGPELGLWCPTCKMWYFVPESLKSKVNKAFVYTGRI